MTVLVVVEDGVILSAHLGTESSLKQKFPAGLWIDLGYKQCASVDDYTSYELFEENFE